MMHDREPIIVQGPAKITPLEAALKALNADITSKHLYLEPAPWAALRDYVAELDAENGRLKNESYQRAADDAQANDWHWNNYDG